jgi:hypothetical protein
MSEHESTPEVTIESLTSELESVKADLERTKRNRDHYYDRETRFSNEIDRAKEYIFEQIKSGDLDAEDEVVTSLAEIFGWELTSEVEATVTATFRVTLTIPIGKSADDLDGELTADLTLDWERSREGFDLDIDDTEVELELD